MKKYLLYFISMSLVVCGCKTINSRMYSESSDMVLYTRGDTRGVDTPTDNDIMYQFLKALNIQAEFFQSTDGSFLSHDQTQEEMLESITGVIPRLEDDSTLYWFFSGHGNYNIFTVKNGDSISYETLFDHMLSEVQKNKKKIKRLVILIFSCYSGSLIPVIQQSKYKDKLYHELIVFTPVTDHQTAIVHWVLPELISSATFLKIAAHNPELKTNEIVNRVREELKPYPSTFNQAISENSNCTQKISYISGDVTEQSKESMSINNEECSIDKHDIKLSDKKDPTWQDLIDLTLWLFAKRKYQTPQFYTYPESLKNEKLFK